MELKEYINNLVTTTETKNKEGFTKKEIERIKEVVSKKYDINEEKFDNALFGITGMLIDGEFITYPIDIYHALLAGIENRELYDYEWD